MIDYKAMYLNELRKNYENYSKTIPLNEFMEFLDAIGVLAPEYVFDIIGDTFSEPARTRIFSAMYDKDKEVMC